MVMSLWILEIIVV